MSRRASVGVREHLAPWPGARVRFDVKIEDSAAGRPTDRRTSLLSRVGRGDEAAFAALYDELAADVFGVARRVVRDSAFAEDVAQETFLDVWRRAPSFDPTRGSATVWVLTIAHRRAVDRVRREDAARRRDERGAALDDSIVPDELADGLERRLDRERVTRALESLTTLQRRAVELAYFDGRTQQEIAQLLDVPLGTVKTRIRDGIIRLRDAFEVTS